MGAGKSTFTFSHSSIIVNGGSTTITITCDDPSYSHKLLDTHGEIATIAAGTTSYTYAPTASSLTKFFQEIPAQKSRLIDIYLDTYDGATKVGRDAHSLTVTLSEDTGKPNVSGFTITDANATAHGWGIIVYGKSSLTATATSVGQYGATISRNVFTCDHNSKHYESYDANDLIASLPLANTPTSFTLGYKSTDSRGFSNTVTLSKSIAAYQAPHIDTFEIIRCDESGTETDAGTKAKVVANGSWTAMKVGSVYKNPAVLKIGHKAKADTSYVYQTIAVSDSVVNVSQILSATLDANTEYEFSIQLTDSFETYSETGVGCSNVKNILYVSADGNEMIIGTDTGNNVAIDSDSVDIRNGSATLATFSKDTIELGKNSKNAVISFCDGSGQAKATKYTLDGKSFYGLEMTSSEAAEDPNDRTHGTVAVSPRHSAISVGNTQWSRALLSLNLGGDIELVGSTIQLSSRIGDQLYNGPVVPIYVPWTPVYTSPSGTSFVHYCVRMGITYLRFNMSAWDYGEWQAPSPVPKKYAPSTDAYISIGAGSNDARSIYISTSGTLWFYCYEIRSSFVGLVSWPIG